MRLHLLRTEAPEPHIASQRAEKRRQQQIDARYDGTWDIPVIGAVAAPTAVLIRPDGYVAWVGESSQTGLPDALTKWLGPPSR